MVEKAVIVHKSIIEEWSTRNNPPLEPFRIFKALRRIDEVVQDFGPENTIMVEESASTGFPTLPDRVGIGNSARLLGARAAYCLRIAREVMEQFGTPVILDNEGLLP